ncbi:3158_t:CDS:10 [Cetraspora pellucida]|uniref:3158_t:CDS:1 n=1 Tax=Cetraspora pellucida TaxID=1433469 RepID=A0A9N9DLV8_9GLOM|nr:3158_t:CDS:10 [Cetraspora pellucida]
MEPYLLLILTSRKLLTFSFFIILKTIQVKSGPVFNTCLSYSFATNNPYNSLLNYDFTNDIVIKDSTLVSNNSTFLCNKIASEDIFCYNGDGKTCAGIVGNYKPTSNITLGNCTGKKNLDGVANYLATINLKDGNTGFVSTLNVGGIMNSSPTTSTSSYIPGSSPISGSSVNTFVFFASWVKLYPWLERRIVDEKILLFCHWCVAINAKNLFAKGSNSFRKYSLDRHIKINEHKLAVLASSKNQSSVLQGFTKNLFPHLCNLINLQLETQTELRYDQEPSTILLSNSSTLINNSRHNTYASYENPVSVKLFLEAISFVIEQSVIKETNLSPYWNIMIDENCSAASITANLKRFINVKALSLENLMYFGSDEANTMLGCKTGVAARLKFENPFITQNHCIAHHLHLVGQDAAEKVKYFLEYETIIKDIYTYFSNSYKRFRQLKMIQNYLDKPELIILNIVKTHWLSFSNIIHNFYQIVDSVMADIFYILEKLIRAIQMQFIGIEDTSPTFGKHLNDYLDQMQMTHNDLPLDVITFITDFGKTVIEKLPKQDRDLVNYGIKEITILGEFYGVSKTNENKVFELIQEWITISLIIPVSNANVERIFSQQNLVKTHLRNQMSLETLNNHLMIIMNGPSIDSFDFERAYDYWALCIYCY